MWRGGGKGERDDEAAYEFALTASRSEVLCWLMMQPIRRPLAPKSWNVIVRLSPTGLSDGPCSFPTIHEPN